MTVQNLTFPFTKPPEMSIERYLLALLTAAVKHAGGELKIPIKLIAEAEEGEAIVKSPSDSMGELVLRFAARGTDLLRTSWETPKPRTNVVSPQNSPPEKRNVMSDDLRMYLLEQKRQEEEEPQVQPGMYPFRTVPNR